MARRSRGDGRAARRAADAAQHAAQVRARAEQKVVTGPLPVHADAEPGLRAELQPSPRRIRLRLRSLRRRIGSRGDSCARTSSSAQGLLDRRTELTGRLTAYQAKAARLGLGEDPDLLASGRIATACCPDNHAICAP